jgi:hypothetical protein
MWVRHLVLTGKTNANVLLENLCGKDYLGDACVDGRIVLKWRFDRWVIKMLSVLN